MSTKREIIYSVFEKLAIESDDSNITDMFVSHLIDTTRAMMIKQQYSNKARPIPIEFKQELCLGLEVKEAIDGLKCNGTILRSKDQLPSGIIIGNNNSGLLSVKTYDRRNIAINVVPVQRLPFIGNDPFTANMIYGAVDVDNRLYLVSGRKGHKMLQAVKVEGVYEQPDKAHLLSCRELDTVTSKLAYGESEPPHNVKVPCEPWEETYPMEFAMEDMLVNKIVKDLTRTLAIPEDDLNNSTDDRR